jgi:carbonic anhydrase
MTSGQNRMAGTTYPVEADEDASKVGAHHPNELLFSLCSGTAQVAPIAWSERWCSAMRVRLGLRVSACRAVILTCMDTRVDVSALFRLQQGSSVVIRNAGGRAADALRSLVIAHHELGLTEVFVVHHTDCHLMVVSEASLWQKVRFATGANVDFPFIPFSSLEQSVAEDVELIRTSPPLQGRLAVRGFIYNVRDRRLHELALPAKVYY